MASDPAADAKDGIWIIDSEAKATYANDRMAKILGTTTPDLIGTNSLSYVFPEDMAEAQRLFASKRAGNARTFRFRLRRADGAEVWVDVQGTPMLDTEGLFRGIVGTFTVLLD